MNRLHSHYHWCMSPLGRRTIQTWSFRASLILGAVAVLCGAAFFVLSIMESQEFRSEEGAEYCASGSHYLWILI